MAQLFDTLQLSSPLYTLVDIGANLTNKCFNTRDLGDVIHRAEQSGVKKIMVTGTSVSSSQEGLRLTRLYPHVLYGTAGVHPHNAKHFDETSLQDLKLCAESPECVAIGECGLDFNRNFSPAEDQLRAFESQAGKPLFVHEREASSELLNILGKFAGKLPPVVVHCFTGTIDEAIAYLANGFYIGLTGFLWKDHSKNGVRAALMANKIPLTQLMLETDSPYMFPNIKAKKLPDAIQNAISDSSRAYLTRYCSFQRNEPCALPAICELVAAFMDVPPSEVAFKTTYNAVKVFGLSD